MHLQAAKKKRAYKRGASLYGKTAIYAVCTVLQQDDTAAFYCPGYEVKEHCALPLLPLLPDKVNTWKHKKLIKYEQLGINK